MAAATPAGLVEVTTTEEAVDVGVSTPERRVEYRYGQAHFGHWLDGLEPVREQQIRRLAADAARPVMTHYRPIVVFLTAQGVDLNRDRPSRCFVTKPGWPW